MQSIHTARYLACPAVMLLYATMTFAQTFVWNNSAGGLFSNGTNWTPSGPPNLPTHAAVFNLPATYQVGVATTSIGTFQALASPGQLTIEQTGLMQVSAFEVGSGGSVNWRGTGTLLVNSAFNLNGNFKLTFGYVLNSGTIVLGSEPIAGALMTLGSNLTAADFKSTTPITIGEAGAATLRVDSAGRLEAPMIQIGGASGTGDGTLHISSPSVVPLVEVGHASGSRGTFLSGQSSSFDFVHVNSTGFATVGGIIGSIEFAGRLSTNANIRSSVIGSSTLLISGGSIASTVTNTGATTISAGRLQGVFNNLGVATISGGTFGSTVNNSGPATITNGQFNGLFDNLGSATISNGTFAGAFVNHSGATVDYTGGRFSGSIFNQGSFTFRAPLNAAGVPITNTVGATITFNSAAAANTNIGTLLNAGVLRGAGTMQGAAQIGNSGTFTSFNGSLVLNEGIVVTNLPGGWIRNGPLSTVSMRDSAFVNQGNLEVNAGGGIEFAGPVGVSAAQRVSMLGGVLAVDGNVAIAPTGAMVGYGQVNAGAIENAGSILFNGPAQLQTNLNNAAGGTITVRNGTTIVYGNTSNAGAIITQNGTIIFEGGGGSLAGSGTLRVDPAGRVIASALAQGELSLNGSTNDPAIITIRARADGGAASRTNGVSINQVAGGFGGAIDLADTGLVIDYVAGSPISSIVAMLAAGHDGGTWSGRGLQSRTAAADATGRTALGIAEALDIGAPPTFLGLNVDASSLLIRHTLYGDANVDGTVDIGDFSLLATNFNAGSYWAKGDFNYDAITNIADFAFLAANFNQSLPAELPALSASSASVPEPVAFVLVLAGIPLARRRGARLPSAAFAAE